ncbi:hypothetical protein EDD86DRAFT_178509, partial [Gorgonomyces haynaldii]
KMQAFVKSFTIIILSEIGDKTFLIAAVMAITHSRLLIFSAAISALLLMTVLSALMGQLSAGVLSQQYTEILAGFLFLVFGVKLIRDATQMTGNEVQEELEEVTRELGSKDVEEGLLSGKAKENMTFAQRTVESLKQIMSPVWLEAFVLTFVAEWGDRSQIATVALAGAEDFWWVTIGGLLGHAICTFVAVMGGRMLATKISIKSITLAGGVIFIIFGAVGIFQ